MNEELPGEHQEDDMEEELQEESLTPFINDQLEEEDQEENTMANIQEPREFVEGYRMTAPQTAKELLRHYKALALSETPVGAVYIDGKTFELSDVVGQESPNRWNLSLLPSTITDLCIDAGEVRLTLAQPINLLEEAKHWKTKGYDAQRAGNLLYIMSKGGEHTFRIEQDEKASTVFFDIQDISTYLKNMKEM